MSYFKKSFEWHGLLLEKMTNQIFLLIYSHIAMGFFRSTLWAETGESGPQIAFYFSDKMEIRVKKLCTVQIALSAEEVLLFQLNSSQACSSSPPCPPNMLLPTGYTETRTYVQTNWQRKNLVVFLGVPRDHALFSTTVWRWFWIQAVNSCLVYYKTPKIDFGGFPT